MAVAVAPSGSLVVTLPDFHSMHSRCRSHASCSLHHSDWLIMAVATSTRRQAGSPHPFTTDSNQDLCNHLTRPHSVHSVQTGRLRQRDHHHERFSGPGAVAKARNPRRTAAHLLLSADLNVPQCRLCKLSFWCACSERFYGSGVLNELAEQGGSTAPVRAPFSDRALTGWATCAVTPHPSHACKLEAASALVARCGIEVPADARSSVKAQMQPAQESVARTKARTDNQLQAASAPDIATAALDSTAVAPRA